MGVTEGPWAVCGVGERLAQEAALKEAEVSSAAGTSHRLAAPGISRGQRVTAGVSVPGDCSPMLLCCLPFRVPGSRQRGHSFRRTDQSERARNRGRANRRRVPCSLGAPASPASESPANTPIPAREGAANQRPRVAAAWPPPRRRGQLFLRASPQSTRRRPFASRMAARGAAVSRLPARPGRPAGARASERLPPERARWSRPARRAREPGGRGGGS